MVTEGDCSCTDTTEQSNVTSLRSDDVPSARNSDANLYAKTTNEGNDAAEGSKGTHWTHLQIITGLSNNRRISFLLEIDFFLRKITVVKKEITVVKFGFRIVVRLFMDLFSTFNQDTTSIWKPDKTNFFAL